MTQKFGTRSHPEIWSLDPSRRRTGRKPPIHGEIGNLKPMRMASPG